MKFLLTELPAITALIIYSLLAPFEAKPGARSISMKIATQQVFFTGAQAFWIVVLLSIAIGATVVIQFGSFLPLLGAEELLGKIMTVVILRELSPLVIALVVVARSGTAIATEIGNMTVNEEVHSIIITGMDPLLIVVFPRIAGVTVALFLLTVYFSIFAIFGGVALAYLLTGTPPSVYIQYILASLNFWDISALTIKSLIFGLICASVPVYYGFTIRPFPTEVPKGVTKAVVVSLILIFVSNVLISLSFYWS